MENQEVYKTSLFYAVGALCTVKCLEWRQYKNCKVINESALVNLKALKNIKPSNQARLASMISKLEEALK